MSSIFRSAPLARAQNEAEALSEVDEILNRNRPKHLVDGIASGVGFVLAGAVGACGILVLSPHVAGSAGAVEAGTTGRVVGGAVGAAVGVWSAASVAAGGLASGVGQIVRGLVNTPRSISEPRHGKWWNVYEGRWIETRLKSEKEWISSVPHYDEDILGESALPDDIRRERQSKDSKHQRALEYGVKDVELYDLLGVDPDASVEDMTRRFAHLGKNFNPNRAGADSPEARQRLQDISEAYVILANPQTRALYDQRGMSAVRRTASSSGRPLVDPQELYSTLYGSEKFEPYIGRLAAASEAIMDEDQRKKMTLVEARKLQKRRVTRIALLLAERIDPFVKGSADDAKEAWNGEAVNLCDSNYGQELVHLIGATYSLCAAQFLGSLESGVGMPSIARWARKQRITTERMIQATAEKMGAFVARSAREKKLQDEANLLLLEEATDEETFDRIGKDALDVMWTRTAVDVANTVHEASQMVLFDQDLNPETRKRRGLALEALGQVFQSADFRKPDESIHAQSEYERIAFYAVLETIRNQEIAANNATAEDV
jgi:hypothetical protein